MEKPVVSVCMITYNHEPYIREAIEGVLMQKTNFPIELIIGEDCSTDNTRNIVKDYEANYSEIIIAQYPETNRGMMNNFLTVLQSARGKYIALCEGDDYWTDPYKLQKQVDFLEENPDYSLCFHDAIVLWDNKSQEPKYFCDKNQKETSTIEDVIKKWFIPSASMVFRKELLLPLPSWYKDVYNGDWAIQMLMASKGKIGYLDRVMSVYRKNQGALSGGVGKNIIFVNNKKIKLLTYFNAHTNGIYESIIKDKIILLKKVIKRCQLRKKRPLLYFLRYPSKLFWFIIRKLNFVKI